jgi:hypothetical protein
LWRTTAAVRTPIANVLGVDPNLNAPSNSADSLTNSATLSRGATTATKSELVALPGKNSGSAVTGTTANNRPISTAVKAINNQLKQSAEQLNKTVKHIAGADNETKDAANTN